MKIPARIAILCGLLGSAAIGQDGISRDSTNPMNLRAPVDFVSPMPRIETNQVQNKLSTLWTVVSLNMIGADVLSSYMPGKQDEVREFAGGDKNIKYFMLAGAVIYEIPIGCSLVIM